MTGRSVVLTGRGVVSPLGVGIDQHWEALCAGRSAVSRRERLATLGLPASRGAEVAPEAIGPHLARLPRKQQKLWNRATLLAMLGGVSSASDGTSVAETEARVYRENRQIALARIMFVCVSMPSIDLELVMPKGEA